MVKRLPRRVLPLLFAVLACVGVAACAVYSIRATADAGTDIGARQVGARRPLSGGRGPGQPDQSRTHRAGPGRRRDAARPTGRPRPVRPCPAVPSPDRSGARWPHWSAGSGHVLFTDAGSVRIGRGTTLALGVEPGAFRVFTPGNTARVAPLWRSIGAGELAVAHEFAKSQHLRLGGTVVVGPGVPSGRHRDGHCGSARTPRPACPASALLSPSHVPADRARPGRGCTRGLPPGAEAAVRQALHRAVPGALLVSLTGPASPTRFDPRPSCYRPARGNHPWVLPAQGPVASPYGPRPGEFHPGIDLAAPLGAPIVAAADGVVTSAGPASGFGNAVVIAHDKKVETVYGHMRYWFVRSGQRVRPGQLIALVGSEGHSTGPHLHFEVHLAGKLTDPDCVAGGARCDRPRAVSPGGGPRAAGAAAALWSPALDPAACTPIATRPAMHAPRPGFDGRRRFERPGTRRAIPDLQPDGVGQALHVQGRAERVRRVGVGVAVHFGPDVGAVGRDRDGTGDGLVVRGDRNLLDHFAGAR